MNNAEASRNAPSCNSDRYPEPTGAMTVNEFLNWARISRSTFYKEVARKRIKLRKVGKRSLVMRLDAEQWLQNLPMAD